MNRVPKSSRVSPVRRGRLREVRINRPPVRREASIVLSLVVTGIRPSSLESRVVRPTTETQSEIFFFDYSGRANGEAGERLQGGTCGAREPTEAISGRE